MDWSWLAGWTITWWVSGWKWRGQNPLGLWLLDKFLCGTRANSNRALAQVSGPPAVVLVSVNTSLLPLSTRVPSSPSCTELMLHRDRRGNWSHCVFRSVLQDTAKSEMDCDLLIIFHSELSDHWLKIALNMYRTSISGLVLFGMQIVLEARATWAAAGNLLRHSSQFTSSPVGKINAILRSQWRRDW